MSIFLWMPHPDGKIKMPGGLGLKGKS